MSKRPVILHAEDNEDHAELVRRTIRRMPAAGELYRVRDGIEALAFLGREGNYADPEVSPRPHMILLDLRLPRLDGFAVLERIRADEELRDIPVVIFSTSAADRDVRRATEIGANSYLVKPTDFTAFQELVALVEFYWCEHNRSAIPRTA